MDKEKVAVILLAAGNGSRMKMDTPKQFLEICGKPLLYYSLAVFEKSSVDEIVLVTRQEDIAYCRKNIVEKNGIKKVARIVSGGSERYESVWKGLEMCGNADYVMIHDAARPCLSVEKIDESICEVKKTGACSLGVPVKDTIKIVDENNYGIQTPVRRYLWHIQTPQTFVYSELVQAYRKMFQEQVTDITDDTMIIERYMNKKTKIIQGDYMNIKVTTPEDIPIVENFFEKNKKSC